MMYHLCGFLVFIKALSVSPDYIHWNQINDPLLPEASQKMVCGYDEETDTMWMIGGGGAYGNMDLISFKNEEFTLHKGVITYDIFARGQSYTVMDRKLWMMDDDIYIHAFDFETKTFHSKYNDIIIPESFVESDTPDSFYAQYACLASWTDKNMDRFLVINGGTWYDWNARADGTKINMKTTQILNLKDNTWTLLPEMSRTRTQHACVVVNSTLYSIGGGSTSVGLLDMYTLASWKTIWSLRYAVYGHRAVVYDENILVIGGYKGDSLYNSIDVINTKSNTISSDHGLAFPVAYTCPMVRYPYVFAFGGVTDLSATDTNDQTTLWQRTDEYVTTPSPIDPVVAGSGDGGNHSEGSGSDSESSRGLSLSTPIVLGCIVFIAVAVVVCVMNRCRKQNRNRMVQQNDMMVQEKSNNIVAVNQNMNHGTTQGGVVAYNNVIPSAPMMAMVVPSAPNEIRSAAHGSGTTQGMGFEYNDVGPSAPLKNEEPPPPYVHEMPPTHGDRIGGNTANGGEGGNNEAAPGTAEGMNDEQKRIKDWFDNDVGFEEEYNEKYFDLFIQNGFDKLSTIKQATGDDLKEIGIDKLGHRKTILSAIKLQL